MGRRVGRVAGSHGSGRAKNECAARAGSRGAAELDVSGWHNLGIFPHRFSALLNVRPALLLDTSNGHATLDQGRVRRGMAMMACMGRPSTRSCRGRACGCRMPFPEELKKSQRCTRGIVSSMRLHLCTACGVRVRGVSVHGARREGGNPDT